MNGVRPFALVVFACLLCGLFSALPPWLTIFSFFAIAWKAWAIRNGRGRVPRFLLVVSAIFAWSLVAFDSPSFWHRSTMISVSVIATLFNLLPQPHRHQIMRLHAGFFTMLMGIVVIPRSPFPLIVYGLLTALIFSSLLLHNLPPKAIRTLLPLGKNLLKTALPVTAILLPIYFFFPEMREQNSSGMSTGFEGDLEPGQLASIAASERLAFRVRFQGPTPAVNRLYWRMAVLEQSMGMSWKKGPPPSDETFIAKGRQGEFTYQIMPDIRMGATLPLLEHTVSIPTSSHESILWQRDQETFRSAQRFLTVTSDLADRYPAKEPQLPQIRRPFASPDVDQLVLRMKDLSPQERVAFLLNFFQQFTYTLRPGILRHNDKLEEFLFHSRKGYCEHFAASFASLMLLAGTPARIVVGYQGGMVLGKGGFMQVLDADAHAWTEVWYDGFWHRVDPTTVVQGSDERKRESNALVALISAWTAYFAQIITTSIKEWSEESELLWLCAGVLAAGLIIIQILRLLRRKDRLPPWERDMRILIRKLEQREGNRRIPGETVYNYLLRSGGPELQSIAQLYNACKFGDENPAELHRALEANLKQMESFSFQAVKEYLRR